MKHIIKRPEPQELLDWKAQDKMYKRGRRNYDRIRGQVKDALITSLRYEQGDICCYCEGPLRDRDSHVEHIKPQETYRMLSCDYDNMVCSCQLEIPKGAPKHCGMSKGSWYKNGEFISPLDQDCETKFSYTFDGQILPAEPTDANASITIEKCQLAVPKLKSARQVVIDTFIDGALSDEDRITYIQNYLVQQNENGGSYNPFYTTIKLLFGHLIPSGEVS